MQNSPKPGTAEAFALITDMIKLIRQGFASHRQKAGRYENPHVRSLDSSIKTFQTAPAPNSFDAMVNAVKACQTEEISTFDYAKILPMAERISDILKPSQSVQNKLK